MSNQRTQHDDADLLCTNWRYLDDATYIAAYIDGNGQTMFVVSTTDTQHRNVPATPPAHERTGRLPQATRAALWPCRGRAKGGRRPCALPAIGDTGACTHHQGTP